MFSIHFSHIMNANHLRIIAKIILHSICVLNYAKVYVKHNIFLKKSKYMNFHVLSCHEHGILFRSCVQLFAYTDAACLPIQKTWHINPNTSNVQIVMSIV